MIRWEKQESGVYWGYVGELIVGKIGFQIVPPGSPDVIWEMTIQSTQLGKRWGEVRQVTTAKKSIERQWLRLLKTAGIASLKVKAPHGYTIHDLEEAF